MSGTIGKRPPSARGQVLRPGDVAPVSGIYRACHSAHREPHNVLVIQQEELPPCRICKRLTEFRLVALSPMSSTTWTSPGLR